MGYVSMIRERSRHTTKALIASAITGGLAALSIVAEFYIGSYYGPIDLNEATLLALAVSFLPGAMFGFFAIWPAALILIPVTERLEQTWPQCSGWLAWLTVGAVAGGPLLFLYSFPLGLGQDLLLPLIANGAVCGVVCAAILRGLLGPNIIYSAIGFDEECAQNHI